MKVPTSEPWIYRLLIALILQAFLSSHVNAELNGKFNEELNAGLKTGIYTSQYIAVDELKHVITGLYPDSLISTTGNQILIRDKQEPLSEILELLPTIDKPGERYTLLFSTHPTDSTNRQFTSTKSEFHNQQFYALANQTLYFTFSNYTERRVNFTRFYFEEEVATKINTIEMTLQPSGTQKIKIQYQIYQLLNGRRKLINNSLESNINEWVSLSNHSVKDAITQNNYSTHKDKDFALFIKIIKE